MTGFNLPPGVSVNMIPGNRPEDEADEAFWDALGERLAAEGFPFPDGPMVSSDGFERAIEIARELAYEQGVADGRADEQLAEAAWRRFGWAPRRTRTAPGGTDG